MSGKKEFNREKGLALPGKLLLVFALLLSAVPNVWSARAAGAGALVGTVDVDQLSLPADGMSRTNVTLQLADAEGRPVSLPAEQIKFTTTLGSVGDAVSAAVYGQYEAVLTAPTTSGVAVIGAEADGVPFADVARISFEAGAPSALTSTIAAAAPSIPADGISQTLITLRLKDQYGNAISEPADSVQLFAASGSLGSVTHATYGRYEADLISSAYGRLGGWTAEPGAIDELNLQLEDGAIPADVPDGSELPVALSLVYRTDGVYQATLTSDLAVGMSKITAELNGVLMDASVDVAFTDPTVPTPTPTPTPTSTPTPTPTPTPTSTSTPTPTPTSPSTPTSTPTSTSTPTPTTSPDVSTPSTPSPTDDALILPDDTGIAHRITTQAIREGSIALQLPAAGGHIDINEAGLRAIRAINPQAILLVSAGEATIRVPVSELDAAAYSRRFAVPEASVLFSVIVRPPEEPVEQAIRQTAADMQARLLVAPMAFEVSVTGGNGNSVFMSAFNRYVTRSLPVGKEAVPQTATGVRWSEDSHTFTFVPTSFEKRDDEWIANMVRPGASIYAVIDRPATFADVRDHWAAADIELLASKLLVQGRGPDKFDPDATITRAEIAVLLVRALGLNESTETGAFKDVTSGWYSAAVNTAYRAGLLTGYQDGTFKPQQKITREELTVMLMRAMRYPAVATSDTSVPYVPYGDEAAIARWAAADIKAAQGAGTIRTASSFRPGSDTSRAEAVAMLARMLKNIRFI